MLKKSSPLRKHLQRKIWGCILSETETSGKQLMFLGNFWHLKKTGDLFVKSVAENPQRSMDDLRECLQIGNCDAIQLIFHKLENEKQQTNSKEIFMDENFFASNKRIPTPFLNRNNYEIWAKIKIILEKGNTFFIYGGKNSTMAFQTKSESFWKFLLLNFILTRFLLLMVWHVHVWNLPNLKIACKTNRKM